MSGSLKGRSGVIWNISGGIWNDVRLISEIMDFHLEMTSPHTK